MRIYELRDKYCSWKELEIKLTETMMLFKNYMNRVTSVSQNDEIKRLVNQDALEKLIEFTRLMTDDFEIPEMHNEKDTRNGDVYRLHSWIMLGALTECVLQMFLTTYIDDYKSSQWQQWDQFEEGEVINTINDSIDSCVKKSKLKSNQGRSLKDAITDKIEQHTKEHSVEKIMLDEIIQFYKKMKIIDDNEFEILRMIQRNRNGIHLFEDRAIGSWKELKYCINCFCNLLDNLILRLPDVLDCN